MSVPLVGIDSTLTSLLSQLGTFLAANGYEFAVARQVLVLQSESGTGGQLSARVVCLILPGALFERFALSMKALSPSATQPSNNGR